MIGVIGVGVMVLIIAMALVYLWGWHDGVAEERERNAKLAEAMPLEHPGETWDAGWNCACEEIATKIRSDQ